MGRPVTARDERWAARTLATYDRFHNDPVTGWRAPYVAAREQIETAAACLQTWLMLKIPFPYLPDQQAEYTAVLACATANGYDRRPGGPSGNSYDAVYLERTTTPAVWG